ncbi:ABC transporter substrate-binding protein [Ornithinimicrobium sediminis]|uniref:ABC transporter substrate-binding protein n=1 Tax=Ornithinimicrobium sediminis TaxID=2904603 RepID=UPI001E57F05F|nr:ABC transporter substrate-binding protein [Ornithinimicrobium sediminis]MCE0485599.1 ABC transporter substrate-binding protein [Ornithinimicrobium sediminis]
MHRLSSRRLGLATVLSLTVALAACGSDDTETDDLTDAAGDAAGDATGDAGEGGSDAAALLPDDIREAGTLTVGTDASYAPSEFFDEDGETIIGMDVDLFDAVAAELGLETQWENADFGTIIGGVNGGRYDIGVSSFTINEERKQEVNMVSYFNAGTQWAVASGNPEDVDPDAPCGLTVAVQANTVQDLEDLPPKVEACEADGNPMDVLQFEGQDQATAALVSGRADAVLADSPVVSYAVQQVGGDIEAVGEIYDAAPYGYVIPLEDTDLAEAVVAALEALAEDGTYESVLEDWGQVEGGIDDFAVNP